MNPDDAIAVFRIATELARLREAVRVAVARIDSRGVIYAADEVVETLRAALGGTR